MSNHKGTGFYPIKGKALLSEKQRLFSHLEIVAQAIVGHLKRLGMESIKQPATETVSFQGGSWDWPNTNSFELKLIIGMGVIKISNEGPLTVAHYFLQPSPSYTIACLAPLIAWPFILLQTGIDLLSVLILTGVSIVCISIYIFIPRQGIAMEISRAAQTAENMVEAKFGNHDVSAVEPEHHNQNPSNLLRTGYYYWNQGQREKGKHYFALLLIKYPWTEEAVAASQELKKN